MTPGMSARPHRPGRPCRRGRGWATTSRATEQSKRPVGGFRASAPAARDHLGPVCVFFDGRKAVTEQDTPDDLERHRTTLRGANPGGRNDPGTSLAWASVPE